MDKCIFRYNQLSFIEKYVLYFCINTVNEVEQVMARGDTNQSGVIM